MNGLSPVAAEVWGACRSFLHPQIKARNLHKEYQPWYKCVDQHPAD